MVFLGGNDLQHQYGHTLINIDRLHPSFLRGRERVDVARGITVVAGRRIEMVAAARRWADVFVSSSPLALALAEAALLFREDGIDGGRASLSAKALMLI